MDDDAIQKGVPVAPRRAPLESEYEPYSRFPPGTLEKDKQHLKTLSIFFYVLAGFMAFSALMSGVNIATGIFLLSIGGTAPSGPGAGPPPTFLGYFLLGFGIVTFLLYGTYAWFLYLAGKALQQYKRRTLIFVMAILICMGFPGIILGIFTIVVLSRESVKELFQYGDPSQFRDEDD